MNISILSYSFRGLYGEGKIDVFGYLEACKYRYGLDAADIWSGMIESTDEDYVLKIKDGLDSRDMVLADIALDQAHIWEDDPDQRQANYERATAYLAVADTLGCKFLRIDAGSRAEDWTSEQFDLIVSRYKEYAQFAYDHGFKMGIENHWGPERKWENLKAVYEAVDHPGFGVSCHMGGFAGTDEEKAMYDKMVAPWVCHTHFPWNICHEDVLGRCKNLWDVGYTGYYSVEHHSAEREYQNTAIQLAQVRDALEQLRLGA